MNAHFILKAVFPLAFLIISFVSSPAFACYCRNKISTIKSNMHTLQAALEAYALDHDGIYPESAELLKNEAVKKNYWRHFKNPYINKHGYGVSFVDMKEWQKNKRYERENSGYFWGLRVRWTDSDVSEKTQYVTSGIVLYDYIQPTLYRIYGVDGSGVIIKDRGEAFYLTNE